MVGKTISYYKVIEKIGQGGERLGEKDQRLNGWIRLTRRVEAV